MARSSLGTCGAGATSKVEPQNFATDKGIPRGSPLALWVKLSPILTLLVDELEALTAIDSLGASTKTDRCHEDIELSTVALYN